MLVDPIAKPVVRNAALSATARASPSPLQLPKRDVEDFRLRQRLQCGVVWIVDDADSPWTSFELALAPAREDLPAEATRDGPTLGIPHGILLLEDDTLVTIATGVHLPAHGDGRVRDGLLRLACAAWSPALARAMGEVPTPLRDTQDASPSGPGTDRRIAAVLTLVSQDGTRHVVPIGASRRTLLAWAMAPGWKTLPAPGPMPGAVAEIALTAGLWLARLPVRRARLLAIRTGDAFWLPSEGPAQNGPLCLVSAGRLIHLGQVDHLTREFQGWGSEGGSPSNSLHAFSPPTEPRNVDALTVDLDFIVGRVAMTVGELSALAAGQIVPLEALTPATVRIVAHGTELGAGQLVEVEGRLAVEILQWGTPR
ncbi:FliM/FliN family flagellar motor switch protein [Roseateles sp. L2-2]|uniref:FliM/FliN family flagellar motor switch protein n=1 Tax=Roseateles sp. L2-2 TaxID=3422597 RepID=UPI003D3669A6